ncbi:MAG: hypothetical protein RLZ33_822 [Bacteroidota bacterium]|jgi:hypothetical protein
MRINFLTLFFVGISLFNFAQLSTSPFSSYGLGEKGNVDHSVFTGIGNSTIMYFDSTVLNFYNPATYNTIGVGQPLYSLGLSSRMSFYKQNDITRLTTSAYFEHFAMAFRIKKHFGFAFGLKPFTRKGYEVYDRIKVGSDSMKYSYLGSGNTSQLFLGLSSNLLKIGNSTLSVGANLSYLFGTSTNERRSVIITTANTNIGGVDYNQLNIKSFHYELGAYYKYILKERHLFTLAATIEPTQKLKATKDEYLFYGIVDSPSSFDTLYSNSGQKGNVTLASNFTLGLNYTFNFSDLRKNQSTRKSSISLNASYNSLDWSKFNSSFDSTNSLLATSKFTVGIQYIPETEFLRSSNTSKFIERIRYRAGAYQYTLPYAMNNTQISDRGVTLGIGIPVVALRSASTINFGFSYGNRGTGIATDLNEKYVGINFGISIAPSVSDPWFRKRKLD